MTRHYFQVELRSMASESWCSDSQRFETPEETKPFIGYLTGRMKFSPDNVRIVKRCGDIRSSKIGRFTKTLAHDILQWPVVGRGGVHVVAIYADFATSDVYVYLHRAEGDNPPYLCCEVCSLKSKQHPERFWCLKTKEMIEHLEDHLNHLENVPDHVFERLRHDSNELDEKMTL